MRRHYRKGTARQVQLGSFGEIDSIDHAIPHVNARSAQVPGEGAPVDTELNSEGIHRLARLIPLHDLGSLRIGQSRLFLAERWDGSMGHPITPVTRENAL